MKRSVEGILKIQSCHREKQLCFFNIFDKKMGETNQANQSNSLTPKRNNTIVCLIKLDYHTFG